MYLNPHFCPSEGQAIYAPLLLFNHPFHFSNSLVRVFGHLHHYKSLLKWLGIFCATDELAQLSNVMDGLGVYVEDDRDLEVVE